MPEQKKAPVILDRPAPVGKTITPKQLAAKWSMPLDGKAIRRHLRKIYTTTHADWALTPQMIKKLADEMGVNVETGKRK